VVGIAHEKASILEGLLPGGMAILPLGLDTSAVLLAKAVALGARFQTFGADPTADYVIVDLQFADQTTIVRAKKHGVPCLFKVNSPGRHFAFNALAALAVADVCGLDPMIAAHDLGEWLPPQGRGQRERIQLDIVEETAFDLIDDAFNANPASMTAALEVLIAAMPENGVGRVGKGRRIAILGDMLELGTTEIALHLAIANQPDLDKIDVIHCVGPRMKSLWHALPRAQRGEWFETAAPLAAKVRGLIDAGDILLAKGSKGIKVSLVVDALRKLGQPPKSV
jgi:UDP-N-acetylmuramoyl-tripeptide--D-alanyl-D-alanine ligase